MQNLPEDIRAEVLLDYLPDNTYKVTMHGLHKRNSCKDVLDVDSFSGKLTIGLARKSFYDSLPEYLFHTFDRFDQMAGREMRARFTQALEKQEKEKEHAQTFFAPVDLALLALRKEVDSRVLSITSGNKVLLDIIGDRLGDERTHNRFVVKALPFILHAKKIRGDRTFLTLLLRKVLRDEGLAVDVTERKELFTDSMPRYQDEAGGEIGEIYAGNAFYETTRLFDIQYWPEDESEGDFMRFFVDLDIFRLFLQDYFMSVEDVLAFRIINSKHVTVLNGTDPVNYLGYNTNL